jgi:oligoribonuclease NrnB/cAMP/cGMP phosphodiesterase (DHH superfamily)
MKNTVIYHSADYDGIFCREIARRFLPNAELIGWNHGDSKIPMPAEGTVYILDLSPDCLCDNPYIEGTVWNQIIWIDHHKTSIEKWTGSIPGYRIDGVAACRLAWQWFTNAVNRPCTCEVPHSEGHYDYCLKMRYPTKEEYTHRKVSEPLAVRLAGEYDIWDKRDPDAEVLQYALRATEVNFSSLLVAGNIDALLMQGSVAQRYAQNVDASICQSRTWVMPWEGLNFLCLNSARFNSLVFAAKDVPETGHDALMGFCFNGKVWTVSLYHAKHRTDLDLSEIAKKYGGGGHRGACGFTCATLPFNL